MVAFNRTGYDRSGHLASPKVKCLLREPMFSCVIGRMGQSVIVYGFFLSNGLVIEQAWYGRWNIMSQEIFDVAIIGAGPAGTLAAITLAKKGRQVLLLDQSKFPRPSLCTGWINAQVKTLLDELEFPSKKILKTPFEDVTFFNADLSKSAKPVFPQLPGYVIDRSSFDHSLVKYAEKNKVNFFQSTSIVDLQLQESTVVMTSDQDEKFESRLLLFATGKDQKLLNRTGFDVEAVEHPSYTVHVDEKISTQQGSAKPKMIVILGLDGGHSFGLVCVTKDRISLDVCWFGSVNEAKPVAIQLSQRIAEQQVIPVDLSAQMSAAIVIPNPSSAVMDYESHVHKHTLLIGDAGGFVASASNEGIYPAMWSAKIAAETMDDALNSTHTQDELMTFNSRWRMQMADYLRSPHTDIRFLLPLVFTNQPMADRMAAAMFNGENL